MAQNDSDVSLEILIRTLAETVGAEKVQAALNGVKESAEKSGEAHGNAAKEVDKHELSHRHLHKIMHAINELVPGLGSAMMVAFSTTAGAVGLLVIGIQVLAGWIEKAKEKHRELAEAAVAGWRAMEDERCKAEDGAKDYETTLKHIGENTDALKQKEEQELVVLNAISQARLKILEAQEQAELAAVKGDPVATAEVEARFKRKKIAEELAAEEQEIRLKQQQLQEQQAKQAEAQRRSDAAQAAANTPVPGAAEVSRARGREEANKKATNAAREELETAIRDQQIFGSNWYAAEGRPMDPEQQALLAGKVKAAEEKYKAARDKEKADADLVHAHDREEARRKTEADAATSALDTATKTANAAQAEVDKAKRVHDNHVQTAAQVAATENAAELARAGFNPNSKAAQSMLEAVRAEEARAHGERMSASQANVIHQLTAVMRANGASQATIEGIIKELMDTSVSHEQKLQDLATEVYGLRKNRATRTLPGAS